MALKNFNIYSFGELIELYPTMSKMFDFIMKTISVSIFLCQKSHVISVSFIDSLSKDYHNSYYLVPINPVFDELSSGIKFII